MHIFLFFSKVVTVIISLFKSTQFPIFSGAKMVLYIMIIHRFLYYEIKQFFMFEWSHNF